MDIKTLFFALLTLLSWGVGSFVAKLATNRIGQKAVFWDILGYAPVIIIFSIIFFQTKNLHIDDKTGVFLGFLAGAIGAIGGVCFYILIARKDASSSDPLTALYPALTAILAFIFLKEQMTVVKIVGIILSGIALVLLSF